MPGHLVASRSPSRSDTIRQISHTSLGRALGMCQLYERWLWRPWHRTWAQALLGRRRYLVGNALLRR